MPPRKTSNAERWLPLTAAIVTVVGSLSLVYWQTRRAVEANQSVVADFKDAVRNSNDLRTAVIRPLEGRWDYSVEWDQYFDVPSNPDDRGEQFFSHGIADIHWRSGFYQVLLGYENSDRNGRKYAVAVNTGTFKAPETGLPEDGARIEMSYSHRLGRDEAVIGDSTIDFSDTPEDRYHYTIERFEIGDNGAIKTIHATFDVDASKGTVTFSRIH